MAGRPRRLGVDGPRQRLERPHAERVQLLELPLQVAGHRVERFAQGLQLVAGAHVHARRELAAREARRAVLESGNRIEEPPDLVEADQQQHADRRHGDEDDRADQRLCRRHRVRGARHDDAGPLRLAEARPDRRRPVGAHPVLVLALRLERAGAAGVDDEPAESRAIEVLVGAGHDHGAGGGTEITGDGAVAGPVVEPPQCARLQRRDHRGAVVAGDAAGRHREVDAAVPARRQAQSGAAAGEPGAVVVVEGRWIDVAEHGHGPPLPVDPGQRGDPAQRRRRDRVDGLRGNHPQAILDVEQPLECGHGGLLGHRSQPALLLMEQVGRHHPAGDAGEDQQRHQPREGEERGDAPADAAPDDRPLERGHAPRSRTRARGRRRRVPG